MLAFERLAELQARKRELLRCSELQRQIITLEGVALCHRLGWLDHSVGLVRRALPVAGLFKPLLAAWTARRSDGHRSWFGTALALLPLARQAAAWWQDFTRPPSNS